MSAPQQGYRIYAYDGVRRIVTSDWIQASSDEEAIAQARALPSTKCELWKGDQLIAEIGAEHRAA